jgi:non-ribosomal peptide synthetase component E (peptide arylation enzyme)
VTSQDVSLTYQELDALTNSFANALLDQGVRKSQEVGLFMTNRAEYLISWFAITRIGAVASPLNPSYKEREVAYQLGNSEVSRRHRTGELASSHRGCMSRAFCFTSSGCSGANDLYGSTHGLLSFAQLALTQKKGSPAL